MVLPMVAWVSRRESLIDMHTDQPDLDNLSLRLFSQEILDCGKLTIKTNHHIAI